LRSVEECYRGSSVRVFRLDRDAILARLRERARALVAGDASVREVRLFGSLARGEGRPGSDADLFVVLRDEGSPPFLDRIPRLARHFEGVGVGCEVVAYTESELAAAVTGRFARAVAEEAIVLASAAGGSEASGSGSR
jgi:predicted nucleotidyltransferase